MIFTFPVLFGAALVVIGLVAMLALCELIGWERVGWEIHLIKGRLRYFIGRFFRRL